ncbi:MAG: sugar transferase [Hyphomicrobiales bacterium]
MENLTYRLFRQLIDYSFALSIIFLFWWLLAVVWILVKFGSEGPGIFDQKRIGINGKVFTCYKFRSMGKDTHQVGTHNVSESAVTPIGTFIRRTKIDELPQVWNILRGELSLVGPRPCLPVQEQLVAERKKRGVLDVLPGITGLAQIQGIDMSDPVRLAEKDAEYIARRGLLLDLKIILATFTGKGQGDRTAK